MKSFLRMRRVESDENVEGGEKIVATVGELRQPTFARRAIDVRFMEIFVNQRVAGPAVIVACIALAGCGGGDSTPGPQNTPPPVITFSHAYAPHQVMATNGTAWMITNISTTLSGAMYIGGSDLYDTLRVDVTVSPSLTSSALAPPGQTGGFSVNIGLDSDGNPNTGGISSCIIGSSQTPFEFNSDNGPRLSDGNYPISSASAGGVIYMGGPNPPAEAVTSINANIISQSFFLPTIRVFSGHTVPHIGVQVALSNGVDLLNTDCEPASVVEQFSDQ